MSASLSTHVLDTATGAPAAGVIVELLHDDRARSSARRPMPTAAPGSPMRSPLGRYRLVFHPPSEFFRRVEYELELATDRHYHVPLLVSPFSCASYRGS